MAPGRILSISCTACTVAFLLLCLLPAEAVSRDKLALSTKKAEELIQQSNIDAALKEYQKVLAKDPDNVRAMVGESIAYRMVGEHDSAMKVVSQALARHPNSYAAVVERARIYYLKGDYSAAFKDVAQAIKISPAKPAAYVVRAHIYERKKDDRRAKVDLDKAVSHSADDSEAWRARGYFYFRHNDFKRAQPDLEKALTIHDYAANYAALMRCLDRQGNTRAADTLLAAGMKSYPNDNDLLAHSFQRLMLRHKHQQALQLAERIIAMNPRNYCGHEFKGQVEVALLDDDAAVREFSRAIELAPGKPYLYMQRAKVRGECGKTELALLDLNKAYECAGTASEKSDVLNERGNLFTSMKRRDEALRDFNELIQLDPANTRAYHNRAIIHYLKNDYKRAEQDWNKAISLQPTASCFERRGILYLKLGRYKEAVRDLSKVLSMQNSPRALRGRALAYEKLGMTREAAKDKAACASDLPAILEQYGDVSSSFSRLKKELSK